ncbi:MAG: hypothetical protein J7M18_02930 [Candidatus Eremiobacteraeota bacterium]|nr:hypothetical protein [Candidatus Eremiobacteraeota bacterium]
MADYDEIRPIDAIGNKFKSEEIAGSASLEVPSASLPAKAPGKIQGCDRIEISDEAHEEQGISTRNIAHLKGELARIKQDLFEKRGIIPGRDNMKAPEYNALIQADISLVSESKKVAYKIPEGPKGISASVIGRDTRAGSEIGGVYLSPPPADKQQLVAHPGGGTSTPEVVKTLYDFADSLAEGVVLPKNTENQALQTFSDHGLDLSGIRALLGL